MEENNAKASELAIAVPETITEEATEVAPKDSPEVENQFDQISGASQKKQLYIKIGYGMGEGGCYIISSILGFYLSPFLLEVAQLPATMAGIVLLLSECVDGFSDPISGKLSDETRTKWGRRRPWMFFGSFPLCIFFLLVFIVPPFEGIFLFLYYMITSMIVKLSYGAVVSTILSSLEKKNKNFLIRSLLKGSSIYSSYTRNYS